MALSVIVVRHGPTAMNQESGNSPDGKDSQDLVRGWTDVPLTPEGQRTAIKSAMTLKDQPIQHVFSSDLRRAKDTATPIGAVTGAPVSAHKELRSWNLGALAGHRAKEVKPIIDHLVKSPNTPAPGGESFNQFLQRYMPFMIQLIKDPRLFAVVSHLRNIKALEAFIKGNGQLDEKTWNKAPTTKPGDLLAIHHEDLPSVKKKNG